MPLLLVIRVVYKGRRPALEWTKRFETADEMPDYQRRLDRFYARNIDQVLEVLTELHNIEIPEVPVP